MKILHILNELKFSGAELMLHAAANDLRQQADHTILITGDQPGEFAPALAARGFALEHIPFRRNFAFLLAVYRLLRRADVDLIHVHTEQASFWYGLLAHIAGKPNLRTLHSEFGFNGLLRWRRLLQRRLLAWLGTVFVACSPRVARNEQIRFGTQPRVVQNWFDPSRIHLADAATRQEARQKLGIDAAVFMALCVGNNSAVKNFPAVIEALRLCPAAADIACTFCGDYDPAQQPTADDPIRARVHFPGAVSNIGDWLAAADAYICASHYEGGPLALLEAGAAGIFCISTRVGLVETLPALPNLIIVQPDAASIAAALQQAQRLPLTTRQEQGAVLSAFMLEHFSPKRGARDYAAIYRELAQKIKRL
ncbi:glycosyltransferase family 4 protein [Ferrovibrio sp.]|uniref:glycosyltransferase family 4 protein n=1 Tax=Ferrovibrio sp. TaxID=1917215 RepID=UPI001B4BEE7A|nr:glycosyltransferase family 4 protein [Ferrovibrio sp.]MBP7064861.1 glycosyltransferase family 4 protein [Ferrovibrio sp.]